MATIRVIAASAPMTHCFVWKRTPRFSGMSNCGAAMREPGRAARNFWPVVFCPPLPTSEKFGCGPMRALATGRCLDMLEARFAQYAVVARMIPSLKRALKGLRYEPMNPRWEIAEFEHRPHDWSHARRCIVARKKIEEAMRSRPIFLGTLCVSSLAHEPAADAGRCVALLRWPCRNGATHPRTARGLCAARKIPTRAFAANALYLEVVRLAYNLVTAFQRTCLPEEWQSLTLSKLRHRLLWLPGELTRPQNRPILRLVNSPLIAQKAEKILRRVHRLKPLES